ncbi:FAD-binding oxidoreductase [Pseudomonadales bacterium]|nr:FAD-binding oxidoreductase [Pseudomonadales bacterium]
MPSIRTTSGVEFPQLPGESILESGEKSDTRLPYSCRTGRCSSCKCQVLFGETEVLSAELGLTQKEKADGWILSCVRAAVSDLAIEVDDLGGLELYEPKILPCRINFLERISNDVVCVILRLPQNSGFQAMPGQHVEVIGGDGVRRSYSIANKLATNLVELHIKKVANGSLSEYWFKEAKENDLLRLNGPLGTFFLRDMREKNLVFLATGTGIAPVKAMLESIEHLSAENTPDSVTVFWGGRTSEDLYYDVSEGKPFLRYVPVLSRAPQGWDGERGYVQEVFVEEKPDLTSTIVYACGSDQMIHGARVLLTGLGLPTSMFFSDAFVSSAPV